MDEWMMMMRMNEDNSDDTQPYNLSKFSAMTTSLPQTEHTLKYPPEDIHIIRNKQH